MPELKKKAIGAVSIEERLFRQYQQNRSKEILDQLLYHFLHDEVYSLYILNILKNREDAEDVKSEIAMKLFKIIPTARVQHFRAWLFSIVKNDCLDFLKKKKILNFIFSVENLPDVVDFSENERLVNRELLLEKLIEEIPNLKDEQRTVIEMHYFQNKKYDEIARCMEIPKSKVKSFIQNGRLNLRKRLVALV